jgi:predicted ATP-binding protein involved in virulence
MILKELKVKNFKGFEERSFSFNDRFNVVIGENAVGKTSLMEAINVAFGGLIKGLYYKNAHSIKNDDVRIIDYSSKIVRAEYSLIEANALIDNQTFRWKRKRDSDTILNDIELYRNIYEHGSYLKEESESGRFVTLPIISYYGTGRLLRENSATFRPNKISKRIDGYNLASNPDSNYRTLLSWFKNTEISVYKSGKNIDALKSVKRAVRNSFEEIETLYYNQENDCLSILLKDSNKSIPVSLLSDGQKVLIGLIGDIALRCNLLNPRMEDSAHLQTPGVVLIDELDLHLHPNWQRKIVGILKETFPKIQFIVTTHSPFIIQSLKNNELIDLQGQNLDTDYINKSIEEIAVNEMNVPGRRSEIYQSMLEKASKYFELVNSCKKKKDAELRKLRNELDKIELEFNEDAAYVALLKTERKIKGI